MNKKNLQKIFKKISYNLFFLMYGKIRKSIKANSDSRIKVISVSRNKNLEYKVYVIKNGRLYTDRIQDTAILIDKFIIDGLSFQYRNNNNSLADNNIVFEKGTPRKLKNLNGKVLSLLTGGAGNENYWHWLYDVLPRLALCSEIINLNDIDHFLLPSLKKKFQLETLKELKIPEHKILSSEKYRHIKSNELLVTNHPYARGNASQDIQNIPEWIILWLKDKFLSNIRLSKKNFPNKIYIDRSDSTSNVAKMRALINENEIITFLEKKGFKSVRLSDLAFIDQVELFFKADHIVGLHGAAFANLIFCKPKTKILELRNATTGKIYENLAGTNNLNFNSIECEPIGHSSFNQLGHINVPLDILDKKINL